MPKNLVINFTGTKQNAKGMKENRICAATPVLSFE